MKKRSSNCFHDVIYSIRGFVLSIYRVMFRIVKYAFKAIAFIISALLK